MPIMNSEPFAVGTPTFMLYSTDTLTISMLFLADLARMAEMSLCILYYRHPKPPTSLQGTVLRGLHASHSL